MKIDYKIILGFFIIFSFFMPLGLSPLFDLDEGAFSEATREMLLNHNFITTYLNGDLRFDKPILIYWFQALSVSIFGLNEVALRLPSAIFGAFWVCLVFWFVKRYFNEEKAFLAAFFMTASLQINIIVKAAIADSLLNFAIASSMLFLWLYLDSFKKRFLYLAFFFVGVGTLTKGPVAIMIPVVVFFIYQLVKRDLKLFFKTIFDIKGIAIFLIVALPWYILEYLDQGEKFINGFIIKHNLDRFDTSLEHHKGSIFYYIPVLLIGFLPFTSLIFKIKVKEVFKDNLYLFLIIWFLFVFIFFSFSGTKLPHYVIYGYTPLFILMALYFNGFRLGIVFPLVLFVVLFIFPFVAYLIPAHKLYVKEMLDSVYKEFGYSYLFFMGISILALFALIFLKLSDIKRVIFTGFIFSFILNYVVIPSYARVAQLPIKEAGIIVKKLNPKSVIMYGVNTPSFSVYANRIVKKRFPKKGDVVLTKADSLKHIKKYNIIFKKNGYYLLKVE